MIYLIVQKREVFREGSCPIIMTSSKVHFSFRNIFRYEYSIDRVVGRESWCKPLLDGKMSFKHCHVFVSISIRSEIFQVSG